MNISVCIRESSKLNEGLNVSIALIFHDDVVTVCGLRKKVEQKPKQKSHNAAKEETELANGHRKVTLSSLHGGTLETAV